MEFTFEDLITLDEAAELLDIGKVTLLRAIQNNELEAAKLGHSYRTTRKALQEYVDRKTIKVGGTENADRITGLSKSNS